MNRFYILLLVLLIALSCQKTERIEEIQFTINGIKIGATKRNIFHSVPGFGDVRIVKDCIVYREGWQFDVEYADEVIFCFNKERLYMARADFRGINKKAYNNLFSNLTKSYGTPFSQDSASAIWESPAAALAIKYINSYGYMSETLVLKDTTLLK